MKKIKDCTVQELISICNTNEFVDCRSCTIFDMLNDKNFDCNYCPVSRLKRNKDKEVRVDLPNV